MLKVCGVLFRCGWITWWDKIRLVNKCTYQHIWNWGIKCIGVIPLDSSYQLLSITRLFFDSIFWLHSPLFEHLVQMLAPLCLCLLKHLATLYKKWPVQPWISIQFLSFQPLCAPTLSCSLPPTCLACSLTTSFMLTLSSHLLFHPISPTVLALLPDLLPIGLSKANSRTFFPPQVFHTNASNILGDFYSPCKPAGMLAVMEDAVPNEQPTTPLDNTLRGAPELLWTMGNTHSTSQWEQDWPTLLQYWHTQPSQHEHSQNTNHLCHTKEWWGSNSIQLLTNSNHNHILLQVQPKSIWHP
jgi:hypothetical protein